MSTGNIHIRKKNVHKDQSAYRNPKTLETLMTLFFGSGTNVVASYADSCRTQRHNEDERHSLLEKYTCHFIWKGSKRVTQSFSVRGSWRPNRTATYWPPLLWPWENSCPTTQLRKILTNNTTILEHQNNKQKLHRHYILETCNQHLIELIFKPVLMYLNIFSYWH